MMQRQRPSILSRLMAFAMTTLTIIAALGLIVSAYSGKVSPMTLRYAPLAVMTFPLWFAAIIGLFVIDLIWWRKAAVIAFLSMIVCLPQMRDFCPINLPKSLNEEQRQRSFTVMTYNVMQFMSPYGDIPNSTNPQLDYILSMSPDIVCIEEAEYMGPIKWNHITDEQLQAINDMYQYVYVSSKELAFLSKYPTEAIPAHYDKPENMSGDIAGWRVHIDGQIVNIFAAHLQSFQFDHDERALFREATTPDDANAHVIKEVRHELLPKVMDATQKRVSQYEYMVRVINKYGGDNVIVCGDFNEPVGCWGINYLTDNCQLKQVYPEVGLGPMVTYNASHFFFRIDHILYRGDIKPVSMTRGETKASDHYPLIATFTLNY